MAGKTVAPQGDPVKEFADLFEREGVAYTFTGAVALAYWGARRASEDIDVVIYGGRVRFAAALNRLAEAGFAVDPRAALQEATADGHTVFEVPLSVGGKPVPIAIDVILPVFRSMANRELSRAVRVPWHSRPEGIMIVTAEDLIVHKLIFFRRHELADDLRDIESILSRQHDLDAGYIMRAISEIYPPEDERVRWFRGALERHGLTRNPPRRRRS